MEVAVFSLFALLALASAVVVVCHRNPVYSTMSLVVTLFSLAVLFVMLGAPFIGVLQVLVYTGAILVLFLFVIMLLNVSSEEAEERQGGPQQLFALLAAGVFAGTFAMLLWRASGKVQLLPLTEEKVSLKALAAELFGRYLLAFEMVGLLLLVAVVAASVLARRLKEPPLGAAGPAQTGAEVQHPPAPDSPFKGERA